MKNETNYLASLECLRHGTGNKRRRAAHMSSEGKMKQEDKGSQEVRDMLADIPELWGKAGPVNLPDAAFDAIRPNVHGGPTQGQPSWPIIAVTSDRPNARRHTSGRTAAGTHMPARSQGWRRS